MSISRTPSVDIVPLLSRGKHRKPQHGACFMEFASYLAGERWSDHPACTHPLLASLARQVNDHVSDGARQPLVSVVPDVIGLTGPDLHIDVAIALRAATTALPVVAEERQLVMAVAVLNCERLLARLDGEPETPLGPRSRAALELAPQAAMWMERHHGAGRASRRVFAKQTGPAIVRCAVDGIAHPSVVDRDRYLITLLVDAIADCRRYCAPAAGAVDAAAPVAAAPARDASWVGPIA